MLTNLFALCLTFTVTHAHATGHPLCTNPLVACQFVDANGQYNKRCPHTMPVKNALCDGGTFTCDYDNESIRFQCSWGKWRILYDRHCTLNGERVANGFLYLNEEGCVQAECVAGRVQFHDCSKGCVYWGRYATPGYTSIDKNFKNQNDENNPSKYVTWRCDYANSFHDNSGRGCRKDGVDYLDGFIMAERGSSAPGIKLLWTCHNGAVMTLGGPGARKYPSGAANVGYKTPTHTGQLPAHTSQLNAPGRN